MIVNVHFPRQNPLINGEKPKPFTIKNYNLGDCFCLLNVFWYSFEVSSIVRNEEVSEDGKDLYVELYTQQEYFKALSLNARF